MSRLAVVLVVLLALAAGCSGFSAGSDGPDRDPYDVEEPVEVSVEDGEELLPGLTTAGVTDRDAFREAHREAIGDRSHTVRVTSEFVVSQGNETAREVVERTIRVDPEAGVVFEVIEQSIEGDSRIGFIDSERNRTEERWFGDATLIRTAYEDGTVEYVASDEGERPTDERMIRASQPLFGPLSNLEEVSAGALEAEDGSYYVLESHGNEPAEEGTESTDVRILVREDGLVRQTVFKRVAIEDDARTAVNRTVEIDDVGGTTVERPDWHDEALEEG